jgi:hypothetical protein
MQNAHVEKLRRRLNHRLNPVHVYCRIRRLVGKRIGLRIALIYELGIYDLVFDKLWSLPQEERL